MTIRDLLFDFPQGVYLIFAVIVFLGLFWSLFVYRRRILSIQSASMINKPRSNVIFGLKCVIVCFVWMLVTLAFMQPKGRGEYAEVAVRKMAEQQEVSIKRKFHDVIFLVDASASMGIADMRGQTRFEVSKEVADEVIKRLSGETLALYSFTSEPVKLAPLTTDYLFVRLMLNQMVINEGDTSGTDFSKVLSEIRQEYFSQPSPKRRTLVLLSDGGDTSLEGLQGKELQEKMEAIADLLGDQEALNLRVISVGLGSSQPQKVPGVSWKGQPAVSRLEPGLLKLLGQRRGGLYLEGEGRSSLTIAENIVTYIEQEPSSIDQQTAYRQLTYEEDLSYTLYFQIPLGIAILGLVGVLFFPNQKRGK